MDPLALLSNLHGDGPATLQRLRRHGCDTLTSLLGAPAGELAPVLGWEPVRTERFLREAEALARRLGEGLLDVEEDAPEPVAPAGTKHALQALDEDEDGAGEPGPPAELREERSERPVQPGVAPGDPLAPEHSVGAEELADEVAEFIEETDEVEDAELYERMRAEVLARWRTLDAAEHQPPARDTLVPHAPPASSVPSTSPGRPLAAAILDGLDPVRIRALQGAGITTLEALAQADDLELHRAAGLPFTVASHLTFLARRAVAKSAPMRARPRPASSDAGGPFA